MVIQQADKKIPDTEIIKIAVKEFELHPKATATDYYKLFFQSFYGPGHLIKNPEIAFKRLLEELKESKHFNSVPIQDIGNGFYRVNLKPVKEGIISAKELLSAFINSRQPEPVFEDWIIVWNRICNILHSVPNFEFLKNNNEISLFTANKKNLVSHSKIYKDCYHPHYRIIHKNYLTKALLNLI
jgi:hypothetical protein